MGAGGSFVGSRVVFLVGSFSFSATPVCSASLGGTVEEGAASAEAALVRFWGFGNGLSLEA